MAQIQRTFLLNGFLVYGICGNKMTASQQNVRQVTHYHYPQPEGKHSNEGQYVRTKDLDGQVSDLFLTLQLPKKSSMGRWPRRNRSFGRPTERSTSSGARCRRTRPCSKPAAIAWKPSSRTTRFSHDAYKRQLDKTEAGCTGSPSTWYSETPTSSSVLNINGWLPSPSKLRTNLTDWEYWNRVKKLLVI